MWLLGDCCKTNVLARHAVCLLIHGFPNTLALRSFSFPPLSLIRPAPGRLFSALTPLFILPYLPPVFTGSGAGSALLPPARSFRLGYSTNFFLPRWLIATLTDRRIPMRLMSTRRSRPRSRQDGTQHTTTAIPLKHGFKTWDIGMLVRRFRPISVVHW